MLSHVLAVLPLVGSILAHPTPTSQEKRQSQAPASYDYVVVGCGASGLVVTNRLSEIAGSTILCLEAGDL